MIVSFDYGGVIGTQEPIRMVASMLCEAGHEVHIISSINRAPKQAIEKLRKKMMSWQIPFKEIHYVFEPPVRSRNEAAATDFNAGLEKARVMKEIGAVFHIDDKAFVVKAIRSQGLKAIHVGK